MQSDQLVLFAVVVCSVVVAVVAVVVAVAVVADLVAVQHSIVACRRRCSSRILEIGEG